MLFDWTILHLLLLLLYRCCSERLLLALVVDHLCFHWLGENLFLDVRLFGVAAAAFFLMI